MIHSFLQIAGSIAFFIFGMKKMSDGVQRAAGTQLRSILRSVTRNRFLGVLVGFISTALVQSSSATTVMTVSLVNAGLLTLLESAGIILGINIGTTITAWLISLGGFEFKLYAYSIPLLAIGVPLFFSQRANLKYWGEFIIGFALLFLALHYLQMSVPDLTDSSRLVDAISLFSNYGILGHVIFVLIGLMITVIIQSSSAAMAITITLSAKGFIPFEVAAAMVLGENIGTTITAEVAAIVGNINARRAARIHTIFNILGVVWMLPLLSFVLPYVSSLVQALFAVNDPYIDPQSMDQGLALFHTAFNLLNTLVFIFLLPWLIKIANYTVTWGVGQVKHIDNTKLKLGLSSSPELAIVELHQEIINYGHLITQMLNQTCDLINTTDSAKAKHNIVSLKKLEERTDQYQKQLISHVTDLSDYEMTHSTSIKLRGYFNVCNDMERIGDIFYQLSKTIQDKIDDKVWFTPDQRLHLNDLLSILKTAFFEMNTNVAKAANEVISLKRVYELENELNFKRNQMRRFNYEHMNSEDYGTSSVLTFTNIFSSLERIGDHLVNISEAVAGEG